MDESWLMVLISLRLDSRICDHDSQSFHRYEEKNSSTEVGLDVQVVHQTQKSKRHLDSSFSLYEPCLLDNPTGNSYCWWAISES